MGGIHPKDTAERNAKGTREHPKDTAGWNASEQGATTSLDRPYLTISRPTRPTRPHRTTFNIYTHTCIRTRVTSLARHLTKHDTILHRLPILTQNFLPFILASPSASERIQPGVEPQPASEQKRTTARSEPQRNDPQRRPLANSVTWWLDYTKHLNYGRNLLTSKWIYIFHLVRVQSVRVSRSERPPATSISERVLWVPDHTKHSN